MTWHRHLVNDGVEETPPSPPDTSSLVDEEEEEGEEDASSWPPCPQDGEHDRHDDADDLFIDLAGANVGFQNWHPVPVTAHRDRPAGQSELGGVWEWTSSPLRRHEGFEPMTLYPLYTGRQTVILIPSSPPFLSLITSTFTGKKKKKANKGTSKPTADFFDEKHNVVLGGSWATHPRIAGRKSLYVPYFFPSQFLAGHYFTSSPPPPPPTSICHFALSTSLMPTLLPLLTSFYSINWYQRNYPYAWVGARLVRDIKEE